MPRKRTPSFDFFYFMAEGLGNLWEQSYAQKLRRKLKEHLLTFLAFDSQYVVLITSEYEDRDGCDRQSTSTVWLTLDEAVAKIVETIIDSRYSHRPWYTYASGGKNNVPDDDFSGMEDLGAFLAALGEQYESSGPCYANATTLELYEKNKLEEEMQKQERVAQEFVRATGKKLGTMDFLLALDQIVHEIDREQEKWNHYEVRAEEFAAHRFAGGGSETYFDDLNYVNGNFSRQRRQLRELFEYMEQKFPLLMCQYKEYKLQQEKEEHAGTST